VNKKLVRYQTKLSDFRVPRAPMISNYELLEKRDKRFDAARHRHETTRPGSVERLGQSVTF
jgi:hypothetical protein